MFTYLVFTYYVSKADDHISFLRINKALLYCNLQTSLAQELDQTVGEREARITELTDEVEQLTEQLTEQQEKVEQLQSDKVALEAELQQRDEDLSQVAPPPLL